MKLLYALLQLSTKFRFSSSRITHYDTLGVKKTATQKEIKQAFYTKSKLLHPDCYHANETDRVAATKAFVQLKDAYDVLRRPADRRSYDHEETFRSQARVMKDKYGRNSYYAHYQDFDKDGNWQAFYRDGAYGSYSTRSRSEYAKKSAEQWQLIWKWTALGLSVVFIYNLVYVLQLYYRERQIAHMIDEDEIAKSFLRQNEFRDKLENSEEIAKFGQILKVDIDAAQRLRDEEFRERNSDEIREEYRWMRAVQNVDHTRRIKAQRAKLRREMNEGRYFDSLVEKYEERDGKKE